MPALAESTDLELLALARNGQCDAYGQLVARHQTLIASVAYGICGDFRRSQDIAQEAFVSAWQQLGSLEDAAKFKGWLCGITRNLSHNLVRRQTRRPDQPVGPIEGPIESADDTPDPGDVAVTREEAAIVWQSLEKLPEAYREPLILFYREHQSIERVAAALDLTEDTVKQRLTRGRGMLRDRVEKLVERSLGSTTPGVMFTATVLSALPVATAQVAAAALTGAAAKGATTTKAAGAVPWLLSLTTPVLIIPFISLIATAIQSRLVGLYSRSPAERKFMQRITWSTGMVGTFALAAVLGLGWWQLRSHAQPLSPAAFGLMALGLMGIVVVVPALILIRNRRRFLEYARNARPPENAPHWVKKMAFGPHRALIYRSKLSAFGLPLIDVRFGYSAGQPLVRGTATGWIALGDIAHGVVFAFGGFAVGGIAIGGVAIGALSIGALAGGLVACGGVAVGGLAKGIAVAIGSVALGSVAVGWEAASGILSVARHVGLGPITFAGSTVGTTLPDWEQTNPIVRTFASTGYLSAFLTGILNAVVFTLGFTTLVRSRRERDPHDQAGSGFLGRFGLTPAYLGWLALAAACGALLLNTAVERTARQIAAEGVRSREAEIKTANDETKAKARYELGKQLAKTGKSAEALAEFLWCFDEGMGPVPNLASTRTVWLLSDLQTLSKTYPPARAALLERRDRAEAVVRSGQATDDAIGDIVALNRSLDEDGRSLALYDQLPPADKFRPGLGRWLFPQFLKARRYTDALQAEPGDRIFQFWFATAASRRNNPAFSPTARQRIHDHNVQWVTDRLEALAGAGQLDDARGLLALALAYDGTKAARATYRAGLDRAGQAGLLADNSLPEVQEQ